MRILVTGGAGFLGSHLCERLVAEGHEVIAYDSLLTGAVENLGEIRGKEQFVYRQYDVTQYLELEGKLDWIMHLASPASPVDYLEHPIHTMKLGALGTMNCLGLAKAKGAGFFLASTSEVYGDPLVHPQPETYWGNVNPIGPRGVYDEAKRFAEAMAYAYHRKHGIPVRVVRIFNSVLADQTIVAFNDGELHLEPLSIYAAATSAGPEPHEVLVPSFDPQTYEVELRRAIALIEHPPGKDAFELRLRYGRSVKVTGDHSVFVKGPTGTPVARPVREICVGDHVAIPARLPVLERDRESLKLSAEFVKLADDPTDLWAWSIRHPGLCELVSDNREKIELILSETGRYSRSRNLQNALKCATNRWRQRGTLPLYVLQALGLEAPVGSEFGNYHGGINIWLPNEISLDEDLLWLLGFYLAEGSGHGRKGTHFVSFSSDQEYLDRAADILRTYFRVNVGFRGPSPTRAPEIYAHSKPLYMLFSSVLGLRAKRIPPWVMQLPLSRVKHFLEGFRCGDGTHSGKKIGNELVFDTTSEKLAIDLNYLLLRFGIVSCFGRYETTFKKRYGDRRFSFYRLTICELDNFDILSWDQGVSQTLNAKRIGDLVWSRVNEVKPCALTSHVYDFSVPTNENFFAGNGVSCHNTFGPRMRRADGRAVPNFITQALTDKPITVHGDGSQTRSLAYVDDTVEGFMKLLGSEVTDPVNIGNPEEITVLDLAKRILHLANSQSELLFVDRPIDDPERRRPDISRAKALLGWHPQISLETGLSRTIEWCRQHWI